MSANQPLRKPRHADGRLMSEDEIRGLDDGDVLRQLVGVCVMGWRWRVNRGFAGLQPPPRKDFGFGWNPTNCVPDYSPITELPAGVTVFDDWDEQGHFVDENGVKEDGCPCWSTDIAAAFGVDRPDWRWSMGDAGAHHGNRACVMVWVRRESALIPLGAHAEVLLDTDKLTPQEYAKARCIAALLLAAKIGE